jgi:5'-nucleotidase
MKHSLAILLVVAAPLAGACRARTPLPVAVQLLAINDFHGNIAPPQGSTGKVGATPAGGVEYLATDLKRAAADNPNSIVVAAGDIIGASPLVSGLFHDDPTIEAMNALGLAVTSVGNHELDHGLSNLLRVQREARFQYLAANIASVSSAQPFPLPPTMVRSIGGVQVGFIGETLRGADRIVSPDGVRGLRFLDEADTANAAAATLERQGVHAIVLLIHQGGRQNPASGAADPNGCDAFTGAILPVIAKLSPAIRVVVSGHTHEFYNCRIEGRTLTSAGSFGRLFTRLTLSIDPSTDTIARVDARNEVVTRDVPKDPAQTAILEKYTRLAAPVANQRVGTIGRSITRTKNAAGESALGDVIADAQLAATSGSDAGSAVVAFMNPGGIRTDLAPRSGRDVTYGDLYDVQPFGNTLAVVTMTGDAVRRLLEQQFHDAAAPTILQVSRGFTYRYRLHAPGGHHIAADSLAIGGRRIEPEDRLRVAASDFLVAGGDGFTLFDEGVDRVGGTPDIDAFVAYVRAHSPVAPGSQNRIVRID